MTDQDWISTAVTIGIGLISGFVSVTRKILVSQTVSKLWVLSECAGVVIMTMLAMDVYPVIEPLFKSNIFTSWITQWVFVGVSAHAGSRGMWQLEQKLNKRFQDTP